MAETRSNLPALIKENLPTVKSQQELNTALDRIRDQCNVLVPQSMNFSSPLHKVALELVFIDPTVDENKNGIDVYSPDGSDKLTLHYKAAGRLAGAAGLNWTGSEVVQKEVDGEGRVTFIEHRVSWEIKKPNGSKKTGSTSGFYSYPEDKSRISNQKMLNTRRRFAFQQAESNAKTRAIFEALEMLPRHFTKEELKKPFLVPCVIEDINDLIKNNPEAQRMVVANALGITDTVYGPQQAQLPPTPKEEPQEATAEVVREQKPPEPPPPPKLSEAEYKQSWADAPAEQRVEEINRLIKATGFTPKPGSFPPEKLTTNNQIAYLWVLHKRAEDKEEKKDEQKLPWEE